MAQIATRPRGLGKYARCAQHSDHPSDRRPSGNHALDASRAILELGVLIDSGHLVRGTTSTIREVDPTNSFEFGPTGPPLQPWLPSQESAIREYFRVLIKRKWTVVGCLITIFGIVAVASFKMTSDL